MSKKKDKAATQHSEGRMKPKNEFRYNFNTNHPNYIFGETEKKYKALGITHESETFGKKNMPLKQNPQKGKTESAYIRNGIISEKKRSFGRKTLKDFSFSSEDKSNVKSKIRHHKKEEKRKAQRKRHARKKDKKKSKPRG